MIGLTNCHDCATEPGQPHNSGCDMESCSVCGEQRIGHGTDSDAGCMGHDPLFARWSGLWPGSAEADALNIDLNEFHVRDYHKIFFIKPKKSHDD